MPLSFFNDDFIKNVCTPSNLGQGFNFSFGSNYLFNPHNGAPNSLFAPADASKYLYYLADEEQLKKDAMLIFEFVNTIKAKNGDEEVLDSNELSGMNRELLPFLYDKSAKPYQESEFLQDYITYASQKTVADANILLNNVISDKILSMDLDSAKKFIIENPKYAIYLNFEANERIIENLNKEERETLLKNYPPVNENLGNKSTDK